MTTHDQHTDFGQPAGDRVAAAPRQGDNTLDPSIAQGDWTAESQTVDNRDPQALDNRDPHAFENRDPQAFDDREPQALDNREPQAFDNRETMPPPPVTTETDSALIAEDQLTGLRARWDHVQASFVDDPRECVQKADGLVSDVVDQLTSSFAQTRSGLEQQWARGEDASTEDLRVALKRYRDFFDRLLAV